MKLFKSVCAWGLIWFFFVLLPVSLITTSIKSPRQQDSNKVVVNLDAQLYCAVRDQRNYEALDQCILRLGKRGGLDFTIQKKQIKVPKDKDDDHDNLTPGKIDKLTPKEVDEYLKKYFTLD